MFVGWRTNWQLPAETEVARGSGQPARRPSPGLLEPSLGAEEAAALSGLCEAGCRYLSATEDLLKQGRRLAESEWPPPGEW